MLESLDFSSDITTPGAFLWKKDAYSRYLDCNEDCIQLFGFKGKLDAVGQSDYDLPCPLSDSAPDFIAQDKKVLATGEPIKFINAYQCARNEHKVLLTIKMPLVDHTSSVIGTQGYCLDITQLLRDFNQSFTNTYKQSQKMNVFNPQHLSLDSKPVLSKRQSECLALLIRGYKSKQAAKVLGLSPRTVEHYIETLKIKLNCQTKTELLLTAMELGFAYEIPNSLYKNLI